MLKKYILNKLFVLGSIGLVLSSESQCVFAAESLRYETTNYSEIPDFVLENKKKYKYKVETTSKQYVETTDFEEAKKYDSYRVTGYQTVGDPTTSIPEGELGTDYVELSEYQVGEWLPENITTEPKSGYTYVDKEDVTSDTLAQQWKELLGFKSKVSEDELVSDLKSGKLIKDNRGNIITSIEELQPTSSEKIVTPYVFQTEIPHEAENDFPEEYDKISQNDLNEGIHIKASLEFLPEELQQNPDLYHKGIVYIRDLYTEQGVLNLNTLKGKKGIDWEYSHILDTNGAIKLVTSANLHESNNPYSIAETNGGVVENGKVYEYWEKQGKEYVKTQWKYVIATPDSVQFHEHELDTDQDGYNFGVGTLNTWYVLNMPNNPSEFFKQVQNNINKGTGASGIANGWANSFGFKKVMNPSEPLESPLQGNIDGPGLYRTTVDAYPLTGTPRSEVINGMIFMEIRPYVYNNSAFTNDVLGNSIYQWRKFYYTDKEEYYALERISAYDYAYQVQNQNYYSYEIYQNYYQTRQSLPVYQKQIPIYTCEMENKKFSWEIASDNPSSNEEDDKKSDDKKMDNEVSNMLVTEKNNKEIKDSIEKNNKEIKDSTEIKDSDNIRKQVKISGNNSKLPITGEKDKLIYLFSGISIILTFLLILMKLNK